VDLRSLAVDPERFQFKLNTDLSDHQVIEEVISLNMRRRDLTPGQRAMIAVGLANLKFGDNQHTQTEGVSHDTPSVDTQQEGAQRCAPSVSQEQAAEQMGVSRRSLQNAKKVAEKAPELAEAVKSGELDVKTAAKVADLPPEQRSEIAAADDVKAAAKEALEASRSPRSRRWAVGIELPTREWDGKPKALIAWIIASNLQRRHYSESQRAMIAARLATLHSGRPSANAANAAIMTQPQAAQLLSINRASVSRARQVIAHGVPELVTAVEQNRLAVSAGAKIAQLPPEQQRRMVEPEPEPEPELRVPESPTAACACECAGATEHVIIRWATSRGPDPTTRGTHERKNVTDDCDGNERIPRHSSSATPPQPRPRATRGQDRRGALLLGR
jgi:hypothetical protein